MPLACLGMAIAGAGQLTAMTTLFAAYQGVLPAWVRGRGLAVVMLTVWVVTSPMAVIWGAIASAGSAPMSVGIAGVGMIVVGVVLTPLIHVSYMDRDDVTPMPTMLDWPSRMNTWTGLVMSAGLPSGRVNWWPPPM